MGLTDQEIENGVAALAPNQKKLLEMLCQQRQELEATVSEIVDAYTLDTAVGPQLDALAELWRG